MVDTLLTMDRFYSPISRITDQAEFKAEWNSKTDGLFELIESGLKTKDLDWIRPEPSNKEECWLISAFRSPKYFQRPVVIALHLYWDSGKKSWVLAIFDRDKGPKFYGNGYPFINALAIDLFGRTCGD